MREKCERCKCVQPDGYRHLKVRDCFIALAAARGQCDEDHEATMAAIRRTFDQWETADSRTKRDS